MSTPVRRGSAASAVFVGDLKYHGDGVECVVRIGSLRYPLFIAAANAPIRATADAFVPLALIPAMILGVPLEVDGPVAPYTIEAADRVQRKFEDWFPTLRPVPIRARARTTAGAAPGVLALFSGGVDSFYTILQRRAELTNLLFVHGFDIALAAEGLRRRVAGALRAAAADLQVPLVEVETNVRDLFEDYISWDYAHGAAIAGVTMALSERIGRVVIPSTYTTSDPFPWGSHPDLDPLWSTPEQMFQHDAPETTRFEKLAALVDTDAALRHLRVCWKNPDGAYNCGRCEKCMRTMAALRVLGGAARATTFPPLDLSLVSSVSLTPNNIPHWQEIVVGARAAGDAAMANAATAAINRHERARRQRVWRHALGRIPGARLVGSLLRR